MITATQRDINYETHLDHIEHIENRQDGPKGEKDESSNSCGRGCWWEAKKEGVKLIVAPKCVISIDNIVEDKISLIIIESNYVDCRNGPKRSKLISWTMLLLLTREHTLS